MSREAPARGGAAVPVPPDAEHVPGLPAVPSVARALRLGPSNDTCSPDPCRAAKRTADGRPPLSATRATKPVSPALTIAGLSDSDSLCNDLWVSMPDVDIDWHGASSRTVTGAGTPVFRTRARGAPGRVLASRASSGSESRWATPRSSRESRLWGEDADSEDSDASATPTASDPRMRRAGPRKLITISFGDGTPQAEAFADAARSRGARTGEGSAMVNRGAGGGEAQRGTPVRRAPASSDEPARGLVLKLLHPRVSALRVEDSDAVAACMWERRPVQGAARPRRSRRARARQWQALPLITGADSA